MKFQITIDVPDDLVELLRAAGHLATPSFPRRVVEPDHAPASPRREAPNDAPRDARQFLGWLKERGREAHQRALSLAKSRGYPTMFVKLSADQVADLYHELTAHAATSRWGG